MIARLLAVSKNEDINLVNPNTKLNHLKLFNMFSLHIDHLNENILNNSLFLGHLSKLY